MARLTGGGGLLHVQLLSLLLAAIVHGRGTTTTTTTTSAGDTVAKISDDDFDTSSHRSTDEWKQQQPSLCTTTKFQFTHLVYNVSIPENSVGKTFAVQPPNEDSLGIKICPNLDVKFRIISGDKDKNFGM